jgi:uncharacterized protein (UPF0333 family)
MDSLDFFEHKIESVNSIFAHKNLSNDRKAAYATQSFYLASVCVKSQQSAGVLTSVWNMWKPYIDCHNNNDIHSFITKIVSQKNITKEIILNIIRRKGSMVSWNKTILNNHPTDWVISAMLEMKKNTNWTDRWSEEFDKIILNILKSRESAQ